MFWFNKNNQFICEFVYTGFAECFMFNKKEEKKNLNTNGFEGSK